MTASILIHRGAVCPAMPHVQRASQPPKCPWGLPVLAQDEAMSAHEYRDDDTNYLKWLHKNPHGYVINIQRSHSPVDAHLHDASCSTLIAQIDRDVNLTGPYVKVCGETLAEVEQWATDNVSELVPPCGICRDLGAHGGNAGANRRYAGLCPACSYELSLTGKCPSCDED